MKKVLYLAAMLSLVLFGFSCTKPGANRTDSQTPGNKTENDDEDGKDEKDDTPEGPKVTTCDGNLVLWISFDNDNLIEKGDGVSFKENKGDAAIKTGFIGKGWTNNAKNNSMAYSKFDVASANLFKKLDDMTFTVWVKNNKDHYKGGVVSLNGGRNGDKPHDFPAFSVYLDNNNPVTIDDQQVPAQQVNGRFIMHDDKGAEQNVWLDTNDPAFAIYDEWFQLAVTYQLNTQKPVDPENPEGDKKTCATVMLYANGQLVAERAFDPNIAFNNLVTEYTNAFYVGAWSTYVEGDSTQSWQSYWAGSIDEIRMYNKALSEEEISALYKEELNINLEQE
jgi:hypothetical protein